MIELHYCLLNQKENFISEKSVIFKDSNDIILSGSWYCRIHLEFERNILVVGKTRFGKTTFIKKTGKKQSVW